jgi:hypothetical protein
MTTDRPPARPRLSFVMTGRNDGFMGDFVWRLETSLNVMARGAARLGRLDDLEVIVVDWNSDVPLHEVVSLAPEAAAITRFVAVPADVAVPRQKDTHFPDSIVINTGIRRARGEFVSQTGSDVVFTAATLGALFSVLEGRASGRLPLRDAFMTGGRRHIPNGIVQRTLPLDEFEAYLDRNAAFFPEERGGPGHAAPTNLMLMHRDLWHACRGFDERFIYWGFNDIDLALRITARHGFVPLENMGVNSLHMEHWSKPRDYSPERMFRKLNPVDNLVPDFAPNDERWGLGDVELPMLAVPSREARRQPEASIVPGTVEELAAQLRAPAVVAAVQEMTGSFGNLPISRAEHPALLCLAWSVQQRKPRAFLEFGFRYPHAAALVARHAPGTELFAVVDWARRPEDDALFYSQEGSSLIFFVTHALRQHGHWAYTHFMRPSAGDGHPADDSLDRGAPFDVALLRAKTLEEPGRAERAGALLRSTGIAVVTDDSPARCQTVAQRVASVRPGSVVVPLDDGSNAMVLVPGASAPA